MPIKVKIDLTLKFRGSIANLFKSPIRGFQSVKSFDLDPEALKVFPKPHHKMVAFAGSETIQMDRDTVAVPVTKIGAYLRNLLKDKL